jgi:hypothetical protein
MLENMYFGICSMHRQLRVPCLETYSDLPKTEYYTTVRRRKEYLILNFSSAVFEVLAADLVESEGF